MHIQKDEGGSLPQLCTKIKPNQINNLNIRAIPIKLLEANLGANLHDLCFGS